MRTFQPDELIISTHPPGRSHWLERGVVEKAREPLRHAVDPRRRRSRRRRRRQPAALTIAIEQLDPLPLRAELRDVHRSALGAGALSDEWAAERLPEHTRARRLRLPRRACGRTRSSRSPTATPARTGSGGRRRRRARSAPVSARSGSTRRTTRSSSCTSGRPGSARGIGSALLAQLLTRQPHDRALLSTQLGSRKARGFYAKNGWQELASVDFGPAIRRTSCSGSGSSLARGYLPALAATYAATALICAAVSWPLNGGMPPPPFVTCFSTAARDGFS